MAVFHPIEYFGIGLDRDIALPGETRDRKSTSASVCSPTLSSISLWLPKSDEKLVMCRPSYMQTSPDLPLDTASSPSSSFVNLAPEALFASMNHERGDISPVSFDRAMLWRTIEWAPSHLMPLNRYVGCLERHEKISVALAINTRCQEPFQDYLPCPGSGPLSAAGSETTDYARQPGPAYIPSNPTPFFMASMNPSRPTTPTYSAPIMMRRYLDDHQEPNWIATVLERQSQSPNFREERQIRNSINQAPDRTTRRSISQHADVESPPSAPSPSLRQCLGKRALPDWDTDFVLDDSYVLTPDDEEEETNLLNAYTIRSALVKERVYAVSAGRPRHHKVQRVPKRRAKVSRADGGSSPSSAARDCGACGNPDRDTRVL